MTGSNSYNLQMGWDTFDVAEDKIREMESDFAMELRGKKNLGQ